MVIAISSQKKKHKKKDKRFDFFIAHYPVSLMKGRTAVCSGSCGGRKP